MLPTTAAGDSTMDCELDRGSPAPMMSAGEAATEAATWAPATGAVVVVAPADEDPDTLEELEKPAVTGTEGGGIRKHVDMFI